MGPGVSRRGFLRLTAGVAGAAVAGPRLVRAEASPEAASVVSLVRGDVRRRNVAEALALVEDQILPVLRLKKYVVVKPNLVSTIQPLAASHADALHGILDFLAPRFKGPVVIAESSAGNTFAGYEQFGYLKVPAEHKEREVTLVDLNAEGRYETLQILDDHLHLQPVRLAARLLDPDAYVICAGAMKTHNAVVATLSVKNMTLGAPLHNARKETKRWNDKRHYHGGVRQTHFDMLLTAQKMRPFWGVALIDGFEGMEGNGPSAGTPVPSRIAIASTDYLAADRVGVEAMSINPEWLGYLKYCSQAGLGQYDLSGIDIRGASLADVRKQYQLHPDIERELQWMGPMTEVPPRLG